MKIRPINITVILILVAMLQTITMIYAQPITMLPAYHNQVSMIAYNTQDLSIAFLCQADPICMYTPLSYPDSLEHSLIKTYFLPRAKYADFKKFYANTNMFESLKQLGIVVQIDEIKDKHYGLKINFIMPSDNSYDVVKIVDQDAKTVRFNIIAKI